MARARIVPGWPALVLEGASRHLVITDTHIGFEAGLAGGAVDVGPNTAEAGMAADALRLARGAGAGSLFLLGDVKDGAGAPGPAERRGVRAFFGALGGLDVTVVPGNHDGGLPGLLPGGASVSGPSGVVVEGSLLTHGHAMPSASLGGVDRIVMGHAHPALSREGSVLSGQRVWVSILARREAIFPSRGGTVEVCVVPAFNPYLRPGARRRRAPSSPVLARAVAGAVSARVATLDGAVVGDERSLADAV